MCVILSSSKLVRINAVTMNESLQNTHWMQSFVGWVNEIVNIKCVMNDGNENTRKYCFVSIAHKSQPKKTLFICHYRYDLSILPLN